MEHAEIFEAAVKEYGTLPQMMMLYEEMGELAAVVNQWARYRVPVERVAEEVADVNIMLSQLEFIIEAYSGGAVKHEQFSEMVRNAYFEKVARLHTRLTKEGTA